MGYQFYAQHTGLMPNMPATLALRRVCELLDIQWSRRLVAEDFRRRGHWWEQEPGHHHLACLQTRVAQELTREREQDRRRSPGAA